MQNYVSREEITRLSDILKIYMTLFNCLISLLKGNLFVLKPKVLILIYSSHNLSVKLKRASNQRGRQIKEGFEWKSVKLKVKKLIHQENLLIFLGPFYLTN